MDQATRLDRAYAALAPGGVLAVFGHWYGFADPPVEAALNEVYARYAPELLDEPAGQAIRTGQWLAELSASHLFSDVSQRVFRRIEPYPTGRYLRLLNTFSRHRMLPEYRREQLLTHIGAAVDRHGGVLRIKLDTVLALGRRNG